MKILNQSICTIVAALLAATGAANAADTPSAAERVVEQFHAALKAGSAESASALLANTAMIYESGYAETREEYISHHLAADIAFAKDTQRTVKSTRQQCDESLCVLMQSSETVGTHKGKSVRVIGQETTVLRREGSSWKIHHVHWSSRK